jgi:ArsR family transcriptional regulator
MEQLEAIEALSALAHETRIEVFRLLVRAGPAGLAAGAIGDALDIAAPTLSFHLKELKRAGLVGSERVGRSRIYRADYPAMRQLLTFLTDHCCEGVPECAPQLRKAMQ